MGNENNGINPRTTKTKKPKGCMFYLLLMFALFIVMALVLALALDAYDDVEVVYDVEQFANITAEELVAKLGEPDNIGEGNCDESFDIPCVYYEYSNHEVLGELTFTLVNNEVIRMLSYSTYDYAASKNMTACFGVDNGKNRTVLVDNGSFVRYACPSDTVDDFWMGLIEGNTFGFLRVTYEMKYYEEWYLPMSDDEKTQYRVETETLVESMLKSPSTAEFPALDEWKYGKNQYYSIVQAYVDAQNSFGAIVREEFSFIYYADTGTLAYAVFNGEVVADYGYVSTADLLQQSMS